MKKIKYPRTPHLVFSENISNDDKIFKGVFEETDEVIVMVKMDGENTTINQNYIHARSLDSDLDISGRRWVDLYRKIKLKDIDEKYRFCGENMFYQHTILYNNLESFFLCFSIYDNDKCLSWDDSRVLIDEIGLKTPKILYQGNYDEKIIMDIYLELRKDHHEEGFVVRKTKSFNINDFDKNVAKFVSSDFIIKDNKHWKYNSNALIENNLRDNLNPWLNILEI